MQYKPSHCTAIHSLPLTPRNIGELIADVDFGDCVELQPEDWLYL
jgi:hypothetical protein